MIYAIPEFVFTAIGKARAAGCEVELARGAPRRKQPYFCTRKWYINGKLHLFYDARSGSSCVSWAKAHQAEYIVFTVTNHTRECVLVVPKKDVLARRVRGKNFTQYIAPIPDGDSPTRARGYSFWKYQDKWPEKDRKAA